MKCRLYTLLTVGSLVLCLMISLSWVRTWAFDEYLAWMTANNAFAKLSQDGAVILLAIAITWAMQKSLQRRRTIAAIFDQLLTVAQNVITGISSNTRTLMKHRVLVIVWIALSITSFLVCSLTALLWLADVKASSDDDLIASNRMKLEVGIDRASIYGNRLRGPGRCSRDALVVAWYRPFSSPIVGPRFRTSWCPADTAIDSTAVYDTKESLHFRKTWAMKGVNRDAGILGFNRFHPIRWNFEGTSHNVHEFMYGVCDDVVIPLWFIELMALIPVFSIAILIYREPTSRHFHILARCAVCGYDLRASPDRCPECGTRRVTTAASMNDEAMDLLLEREGGNRPAAASLAAPSPGTSDFSEFSQTGEG